MKAMAIISGHVMDICQRANTYTNKPYTYIIIEVQGCRFDVVVDESFITSDLVVGGVASGAFWLTGTITGEFDRKEKRGYRLILIKEGLAYPKVS